MIVYYLMYFVAFILTLYGTKNKKLKNNILLWWLIGIFYILFIAFRECGGDYNNYLNRFNELSYLNLSQAISFGDKSYQFISYYINKMHLGFVTLTFICAFVSISGLISFLRRQYNPWLGLAVAVPYLIIVVYMGYMRQGIAIGLVMMGLVELSKGRFWRFVFFVILATSFHKSAIMMISFGIFAGKKGKLLKAIGVLTALVGVWTAFVSSEATVLWQNYVEAQIQSQGAMIRVVLNNIPALLLFYFRKEWKRYFSDYNFWKMIALASIASLFLVKFSSTAVDRMALYFIPLQIVVYSRLPLLSKRIISPLAVTYLILFFYLLVLTIWLNFATHAYYWVPYRNVLFNELF